MSEPDPALVFRRTRRIAEPDIDVLGHVNNVVWVQFVVELADAHASSLGFGWKTLRRMGALWIVRRHEVDYRRSALPDEEIAEETWVDSMSGARSLRRWRFTRASDGVLLVEGVTTWAFVHSDSQKPRRIPAELRTAFCGKVEAP